MISYPSTNVSWEDWCGSMAELFASNQLGFLPEEKWRDYADGMQGIGYFVQNGIPEHRNYSDWRSWANDLAGIMNVIYQPTAYY